ncbi:MAG: hypothetical protein OSA81_08270 [Longimicrobiales bacterium]|nr:hypothetical protein [Longimicrobiales bacterium]
MAASVERDASRGLTLEELRRVAGEVGIDPRFIDLAARDLDGPVERYGSRLGVRTDGTSAPRRLVCSGTETENAFSTPSGH